MSQGWSCYNMYGNAPYQYYQQSSNTQACNYNYQTNNVTETSIDLTVPTTPPPGLSKETTELIKNEPAQNVYQEIFPSATAYLHPQFNTTVYGSDPAMDAAQRWNAMNCSYMNYQNVLSTETAVQSPASFSSISGPRFPMRDSGKLTNGATYSVYPGPKSQDTITNQSNNGPCNLSESGGGEKQWSPELKDYVQRAFCSTDTSIEKDQMERILREKLEYVFRNKIQIDWSKEPVPFVPSKSIATFRANNQASPVNIVRPISMAPRRPRGRVVGHLPTGTLRPSTHPSNTSNTSTLSFSLPGFQMAKSHMSPRIHSPVKNASYMKSRLKRHSSSRSSSSSSCHSGRSRSSLRPRRHINGRSLHQQRLPSANHYDGNRKRNHRFTEADDSDSHTSSYNRGATDDSDVSSRCGPSPRGRGARKKRGRGNHDRSQVNTTSSPPDIDTKSPEFGGSVRGKRGGRGRGGKNGVAATNANWSIPGDQNRLNKRADRFKDHLVNPSMMGPGSIAKSTSQLCLDSVRRDDQAAFEMMEQHYKIVGTMHELEKSYLRLTSAPDPSNVRPPSVLVRALAHIKQRWREKSDYNWVCEQFKSIRQDLTVQGIQTELTAQTYEEHADVALAVGDSQEFHQCQSQLSRLHLDGLGANRHLEFTAYRLLYYIFTLDFLGMSTILASFRESHKSNPHIQFALQVRKAWALRNYKRFFELACPPSSKNNEADMVNPLRGCQQVLSWSLDRERKLAIKAMFKSYRPSLSLDYVSKILGFPSSDHCSDYLIKECKILTNLKNGVDMLDCKEIWSQLCAEGSTE